MKAVMISIQPKWVEKIANGEKTIEVRKTAPKLETPFKCYIYETKTKNKVGTGMWFYGIELKGTKQGVGKVIGEFICDCIDKKWFYISTDGVPITNIERDFETLSCLKRKDIINYALQPNKALKVHNGTMFIYGLHISNLKIYDKPKELGEFNLYCERAVEFDNMVEGQGKRINGDWRRDRCLNCIRSFPCPVRGDGDGITIAINCDRRIKTAPQSWCYVEI